MRPTILVALSALTLGAPALAHAQTRAHPDFTGTWVMDTVRTSRAGMSATSLSYVVTQTPTMLSMERLVVTPQGAAGGTLNYALDGKPTPNHVSQGGQELDASSTLAWAADTLVLSNAITVGDRSVQQTDRWVLAPGGKELSISRKLDMGGEVRETSYVMVKK